MDRLNREGIKQTGIEELAGEPTEEWKELFADHPMETQVSGEDLVKLVFMAKTLAGARSFWTGPHF